MTTIYISSTYKDLIKHREAVGKVLRQMNKVVLAMEDYSASDERPLDKCLADVAKSDIYVGIFALRYGFIPLTDNPNKLSITELEYRQAVSLKKPCLIFLLDEDWPWPPSFGDSHTKEGDNGDRIRVFRERLSHDHTRTLFRIPKDLAASVSSAVSNLMEKLAPGSTAVGPGQATPPIEPCPRELTSDIFLAYSDIDKEFAKDISDYLLSNSFRVLTDSKALFSDVPDEFQAVEQSIRLCHAAFVLVSDQSLIQLEERHKDISKLLRMIKARTGTVLALFSGEASSAKAATWPVDGTERVDGWQPRAADAPAGVHQRLERLRATIGLDVRAHWVGLPVIVIAMTAGEAAELDKAPGIMEDKLSKEAYQRFLTLRKAVLGESQSIAGRYGPRRDNWMPFPDRKLDIRALLDGIVGRLNQDPPAALNGRSIKIQNYEFDEILQDRAIFGPIFTQLLSTGCVVIVDEYSLFHPAIQDTLMASGLIGSGQVAIVTLSPSNPYSSSPFNLLETELSQRLAAVFDRFGAEFDPQCELSVGDEKRLKRWLNSSLPYTIYSLRNPRPNRQNISMFSSELNIDVQPKMASELYSAGGPL